jgi:hypothetical protein
LNNLSDFIGKIKKDTENKNESGDSAQIGSSGNWAKINITGRQTNSSTFFLRSPHPKFGMCRI